MDIATVKAKMSEFFGKDDMYRMPLGVAVEDWLVAEHDRLSAALTSAKEEIERTEKLLADQDELRARYYHHGLKEHPEKAVRDAMIQLEAAESSLSSERKETERLRFATSEVSTHLGAIEAIIKTCIELKPSKCILTDKYDGICPHCESDISWLHHELKAHGEYSKAIAEALHPPQQEEQ